MNYACSICLMLDFLPHMMMLTLMQLFKRLTDNTYMWRTILQQSRLLEHTGSSFQMQFPSHRLHQFLPPLHEKCTPYLNSLFFEFLLNFKPDFCNIINLTLNSLEITINWGFIYFDNEIKAVINHLMCLISLEWNTGLAEVELTVPRWFHGIKCPNNWSFKLFCRWDNKKRQIVLGLLNQVDRIIVRCSSHVLSVHLQM